VIDADIVGPIKETLSTCDDMEILKEAVYCISNAIDNGDAEQRQ
jgi:hypothetical protein